MFVAVSMKKQVAIYVRCSTDKTNTKRQVYELEQYIQSFPDSEVVGIYNDEAVSAVAESKPEYERMLSDIRSGKVNSILVTELSRLGRSVKDLCNLVAELNELDVGLIIKNQNIDTSTSAGRLFFNIISAISEYERELLSERIKSKLNYLKSQGVKLGRRTNLTPEVREQVLFLRSKKMGILKIGKKLKLGTQTIYRVLEEAT